ncbi:MAG: hypothetical protein Q8Q37_01055 [bacterium]|nr:hypothetical protein [bacterium]
MMNNLEKSLPENESAKERLINLDELAKKMESDSFRKSEVLGAFVNLVESLKEKLPSYDTIISDEASGRVVSLALRSVINEARNREHNEDAKIYFLALSRHYELDEPAREFIRSRIADINKVLVVTEFIESGRSMNQFAKFLDSLEIDFDIAALSIIGERDSYPDAVRSKIFFGKEGSAIGNEFYENPQVSGVVKDFVKLPHPSVYKDIDQENISKVRRDVDRLADELKKVI